MKYLRLVGNNKKRRDKALETALWRVLAQKNSGKVSQSTLEKLESFVGCWVMADHILCKLITVNKDTGFLWLDIDGGIHSAYANTYFSISVPYKK